MNDILKLNPNWDDVISGNINNPEPKPAPPPTMATQPKSRKPNFPFVNKSELMPSYEHRKKPAYAHMDLWEYIVANPDKLNLSCRQLAEETGYSKTTCHTVQAKAREIAYGKKRKEHTAPLRAPAPVLDLSNKKVVRVKSGKKQGVLNEL